MNEKPHYPARTVMKIIVDYSGDASSDGMILTTIENVFHTLLLAPRDWKNRKSRNEKYISYTTTVYIQNREQLVSLYDRLLIIPEVRQVL